MQSVSINVEPGQYLSGWRPEAGALFVPALSGARVGDRVAVRLGLHGQAIRATVYGRVALVRRLGRPALPPGVELTLDRESLPAAGFLAMAARGEALSFRERAPRFPVVLPLTAAHGGGRLETVAVNVSEGGCALRWPAPFPPLGDVVALRLGAGVLSPAIRGVVCWSEPGGAVERGVGLRIVAGGRAGRAWRARVDEVARAGGRLG